MNLNIDNITQINIEYRLGIQCPYCSSTFLISVENEYIDPIDVLCPFCKTNLKYDRDMLFTYELSEILNKERKKFVNKTTVRKTGVIKDSEDNERNIYRCDSCDPSDLTYVTQILDGDKFCPNCGLEIDYGD